MVIENSAYGLPYQWHKYGKGDYGYTLIPMEYKEIEINANGFGIEAETVFSNINISKAIRNSFMHDGPYVAVFKIPRGEEVLPIIPPGGGFKDIEMK